MTSSKRIFKQIFSLTLILSSFFLWCYVMRNKNKFQSQTHTHKGTFRSYWNREKCVNITSKNCSAIAHIIFLSFVSSRCSRKHLLRRSYFFLSLRGFSTLIRKAEQKIWLKYICKGTLFLFTFFLVLADAISRWNNIYWNFDRKGQWEMSRWKSTTDNANRIFVSDDQCKFEK